MLHEQEGYPEQTGPPITHWGSDSRMVSVLVTYNEGMAYYYIQGWGDNAI